MYENDSGPLAEINVPKSLQPKGLYFIRPSMQHYLTTREEIDEAAKILWYTVLWDWGITKDLEAGI